MEKVHNPIFSIPLRRLDGFFSDKIFFRDAKARTPRPSLFTEGNNNNERRLLVHGKFLLKHEYRILKKHGECFVDITNDKNLIHRKGNIVPGAMTVSKIVLPLEILFPELEISSVNIKFTDSAYYGARTCSLFLWEFVSNEYAQIEIKTYQHERAVARTIVLGRIKKESKKIKEIEGALVNKRCLTKVKTYFESLEINSDFYFHKDSYRDYTYPLAYVASLPSAEIVNQLSGQGGMINILRMDFGNYERIPITGDKGPEVKLARAKKRSSFNKILTEVAEGLVTYYKGLAIVNPVAKFQSSSEPVVGAITKLIHTQGNKKPLHGTNKM
ncbi:MAG: hypothetical protein MRJ65_09675 [Candidatus Brocadiaceae bacterium]|nr:hypothetical protein [Candidatus Brocadiaceae bacterium]